MESKTLKTITQTLLLAVIAIVPFVFTSSLYFPYVSGKAYLFRVLVSAALFFWVWLVLKDKSYLPNFKNILIAALILFFLAQVLASIFGVDARYSFFGSIERAEGVFQYGFWLIYFLTFVSVFRTESDWKKFFAIFIIMAVLVSAFSWLTRVLPKESAIVENQPNLFGYQEQLIGIFGNPAYFAAFLLFAIGLSFLALERRFFSKNVNNFLLAAVVLFILTLIFTKIRGAYAGLAGGVFLFCVLSLLFLRRENPEGKPSASYGAGKKLANWCGVVLLVGAVSITSLFVFKETEFVKSRHILSRITEVADIWKSDSVRERLLNWNIALKAFREKPIFGYGPENYAAASNKYYDFRVGKSEPWFDRAHNQALDTLATGGLVVFLAYLFWFLAAAFLIFKIGKTNKLLSFILGSIFLAYFIQGFFLFDTLAVFLGLFPFLAYLIYLNSKSETLNYKQAQSSKLKIQNFVLVVAVIFSVFLIYATVLVPYKANAAVFKFLLYSENGFYEKSEPYLKKAFIIKSPYTYWEVRKRAGWQFSNILEYEVTEETPPEKIEQLKKMYGYITQELEKFIEARPTDQQIYYVLGRVYRFGYEKLGFDDLDKSEAVFQKALLQSDLRVEYFNEYARVLLLQGKFEEAEKMIKDYLTRVSFYEYFPFVTLGHLYFSAEKYDLAFEEFEKARKAGYSFVEVEPEYARYISVAEHQENYQAVVDMVKLFLERWGPDADTYFNLAVGYLNLEEKEKAREFFSKAVELKPEYEEYRPFFTP